MPVFPRGELGPSQYEFTFAPERGLASADTMALFRSAMKRWRGGTVIW